MFYIANILLHTVLPFALLGIIFDKIFLMKIIFCFIVFFTAGICAKAQFYYNDIVVTQQVNKQHMLLRTNHVQLVSAKSFTENNEQVEGFYIEQQVENNAGKIVTNTATLSTGKSVSVSIYTNNHLSKTLDSSGFVTSTTVYNYDANNLITTINSITNDTFMKSHNEEIHEWHYNGTTPVSMLRIKDKTDTTVIEFITDEQGNIAEERWKRKNVLIETYYYYYNDKHLLTDIVRFNKKAKRLLPDFLFTYNEKDQLAGLTQIPESSGSYLTWNYFYNDNGLKQKELCFDKQKQLVGKIEYTYQ